MGSMRQRRTTKSERPARTPQRKTRQKPGSRRATVNTFAEELPGMVFIMDVTGGVTYANKALLAFTGNTLASVHNECWQNFLHPEDHVRVRDSLAAAVRARLPFGFECRYRNQSGDYRWLSFGGTPRFDNARYAGYTSLVTDITPRRSAEDSAARAWGQLRTVLAAVDDICIGIGSEEEINCWNSAAERCTGIPATETIGHPAETILTSDAFFHVREAMHSGRSAGISSAPTTLAFRARPDLTIHGRIAVSGDACIFAGKASQSSSAPVSRTANRDGLPGDDRLLALLESLTDTVLLQDPDGRYLYCNNSAYAGVSRKQLIGNLPGDVHDSRFATLVVSRVRKVVTTGAGCSEETSMEQDGRLRLFLDQLSPLKNADKVVVAVATLSRDVTEHRKAGMRLRESEERYRMFVENSNEGILRIETHVAIPCALSVEEQIQGMLDHAYIAECNSALARLFGFDHPSAIIGTRLSALHKRGNFRNVASLRRFVESGYRLSNWEDEIVAQDGTNRHVQQNMVGTIENGALVRAWGSLTDISERKGAERELRLLAQTITSTRDCVSITDLNNRILFVNDAFLSTYGFAEEDLLGNNIALVCSEPPAAVSQTQIDAAPPPDGWYGETMHRRADGTLFPVELWTSVVHNDEGEPVALVGVARDIAARKIAEEKLRASLREKEVLLKEIHHRVKNNLQVISSLLSLQSEYLSDQEMVRVFKESQNRVKSMALIHEKLYQSKNLAEIDFGEYLRELTTQLFRSYGVGTNGVLLNVNASVVLLAVDRAIPCGIIVNELVTNAIKYAFPDGRDGEIDVDLRCVGEDEIRLAVRDNGVGLPPHVDLESTDSLGLTLVRMLVEQIQGTLTIQKNDPGTEFVMTLRRQ